MKRILFFIPTLGGGGAERVLTNLVNNMDSAEYEITVQTLFDVGVNRSKLGKHIKYIPGMKKQFPGNVWLMKFLSPRMLYRLLIKTKYDIVVSYLEGPTARIVSGCSYDAKLISWIHVEQNTKEAASYSFRSYAEAQRCYERFDKIICVAETVRKDFKRLFGIDSEVLYNTNETNRIVQLAQEPISEKFPDEIKVFSIGRLRPEKGYDRLISTHRRLLREGIRHHVYILGEGTEEENLRKQINESGVEKTFHLLGFKENPYAYLSHADLFVCSSRREGFSTAVTEALVLGLPVVSTCCSGATELLGEHDEYGIVVENSKDGVYDGMRRMLNPQTMAYYRSRAAERSTCFSKERTVAAVENMLKELVGTP